MLRTGCSARVVLFWYRYSLAVLTKSSCLSVPLRIALGALSSSVVFVRNRVLTFGFVFVFVCFCFFFLFGLLVFSRSFCFLPVHVSVHVWFLVALFCTRYCIVLYCTCFAFASVLVSSMHQVFALYVFRGAHLSPLLGSHAISLAFSFSGGREHLHAEEARRRCLKPRLPIVTRGQPTEARTLGPNVSVSWASVRVAVRRSD